MRWLTLLLAWELCAKLCMEVINGAGECLKHCCSPARSCYKGEDWCLERTGTRFAQSLLMESTPLPLQCLATSGVSIVLLELSVPFPFPVRVFLSGSKKVVTHLSCWINRRLFSLNQDVILTEDKFFPFLFAL